ncbi:FAD-binding protein [Brevibacillus thermoruber]|uniref:D-lactate dehydrogenase (cytochrome) n=1 Tax=Brevibacillus thermoruber TaxID=33942 RepID=A0A9X3TNE0_9BACL|nr:FAD-linked oxidase C-terminal domain-containing protein [Brevibacillus thermoruber]MDA5107153.1 FAD-binding protein [Brevibacillus thermoruber]
MNLTEALRQLVGHEQVSVNPTMLEQHSRDESYHRPHTPDVVVFPRNAVEVSEVVKFANSHRIPVVPFGMGTSLEGHVIPYQGGITLDFQRMNQIVEIRPEDQLVRVQPGVTRSQLNKELKKYGLFFSVDPGADATLGGMAATNASGTTAVRYGVMRDQVRDLEVVLANGQVIRTGGLAVKSSAGYNLTGLFVGSEGTLGIFTELTLRVYGIPESILAARASFPSVESAVRTAVSLLAVGIPIARVELVDRVSMEKLNRHSGTHYEEAPTLFLEFHGNEAGLQQDVQFAKDLAADHGCSGFAFETDAKGRNTLWEARHNLAYAFVHGSKGKKIMVTDVCVPLSELAGAITYAREQIEAAGVEGGLLGHVGDGNFHALLLVDPTNRDDLDRAERVNANLVDYALRCGGTCTGEHGVGVGKLKYLRREHGEALDLMRQVKQLFDPHNILNPGKKLPID